MTRTRHGCFHSVCTLSVLLGNNSKGVLCIVVIVVLCAVCVVFCLQSSVFGTVGSWKYVAINN